MWGEGEGLNMRRGHGLSAQGHQYIKTRLPWSAPGIQRIPLRMIDKKHLRTETTSEVANYF
jgi:hypothetical protein